MDCKVQVKFLSVKYGLVPTGLPDLDYALNPYIGCQHGCMYCYAPNYVDELDVKENWGKIVYVKENIHEVLLNEVSKKKRGIVGLGTITDGYQPIESIYGLTRTSLKLLLSHGFRVSLQTKSSLVLRDVDLFLKFKKKIDIGFTITVMNNSLARIIEPCSTPPEERIKVLIKLKEYGLSTWLFLGPLIQVDDSFRDHIENLLISIAGYVDIVYYDQMRLKPNIYTIEEPLRSIFIKSALNKKYLIHIIEDLCEKYNIRCRPAFSNTKHHKLQLDTKSSKGTSDE